MSELVLKQINACVIVPTYNNRNTLNRVIDGVLHYGEGREVIVVNDGSTDDTEEILLQYGSRITVLKNERNSGKGTALKRGFRHAIEQGFDYAITIDSDGQHYPDDIPLFIAKTLETPGLMLMGARNMAQAGVPGKSSFGNKFSNFWYKVETGIELPDTQTGFRMYPLAPLKKMRLFTTKFELEIEVIVKMAWRNIEVKALPIKVLYDPNERVTHFRPFRDFTRITILNTYFVILTVLYHFPKRILTSSVKKSFWEKLKDDIFQPGESATRKAASVGFGLFMGIIPVWGFQLLIGIALAVVFRLNKVLFVAAANISVPPMIPVVIAASIFTGNLILPGAQEIPPLETITLADIHLNLLTYAVGAVVLAGIMGMLGFVVTYGVLTFFRKPNKPGKTHPQP
ncbi:MAG: DUF2062 domain-containing protein [Bacteroidota bacterium]